MESVPVPQDDSTSDGNTIRGNWSHKMDFLLTLIGYSVGLGNIWRFPYLVYRNGGGAFLIPYFIMLVISGLPLFFLELCIGQYVSLGPIAVWGMCPPLKGVGIAAMMISGVIGLYYNTINAYILFYLFASMTSQLPWTTCGNPWNTPACTVRTPLTDSGNWTDNSTFTGMDPTTPHSLYTHSNLHNTTLAGVVNTTARPSNLIKAKSPAEEYFEHYVLGLSEGIDDVGYIRWRLMLCFLLAWTLVFLCLIKGIKSIGKVVYFTAVFPYFVLMVLLVRGLTLPGSVDGVLFYVVPVWSKLLETKVWGDAATQIFYSLGPAWGGIIAFASFNKFHANCQRDAIFSSAVCCGTSVFAGFVIFSMIGFMARELNLPISEVMEGGPGLAFIVYPEAVARMPVAPLWSIIFFLMLLCVGLGSMFAMVELVIVSIMDELPRNLQKYRIFVTFAVCTSYFLLGLIQVTECGMYVVNLIDWYIAPFSILIVAMLEVVVAVYIYGYKHLAHNIYVMMGFRPNIFFRVCWFVLTPGVLLFICVSNGIKFTHARYGNYDYPDWADALGWILGFTPVMCVPGYMIYHLVRTRPRKGRAGMHALWRPRPEYGPMMPKHRLAAGLEPLGEDELKPMKTQYSDTKLPNLDEITGSSQEDSRA